MSEIQHLHLTVTLDPGSGFCSGVVRAIRLAEELLDKGEDVYSVGKIVHNEEEMKRLQQKGLHVISHKDLEYMSGKNILFRAHGEPPSSYSLALKNQNNLIDASCKIVLSIQDKIRSALAEGEKVVIFGKKDHPEVRGLQGQGPKDILVVQSLAEAQSIDFPKRITLFSQTTMSLSAFYELAAYLENKGIEVTLKDTVCRQVHNRETYLAEFARHMDIMIFISGKESSNGKVLFNICHRANPNSYFITGIKEIQSLWFIPGQKVGISGATSTPAWLLEDAKDYLESL